MQKLLVKLFIKDIKKYMIPKFVVDMVLYQEL